MSEPTPSTPTLISIGGLSQATGVPVETLRTWERRYGFPAPERTPSGHRRYQLSTIERLRLITQALELGHRPSSVVGAELGTLQTLLEISDAPAIDERAAPQSLDSDDGEWLSSWLGKVTRLDGDGLDKSLQRAWSVLGAMRFMTGRLDPFLVAIGERWERGFLTVSHEHFASERIHELLASKWRPFSDSARGPRVICATLPGERHTLGLHMVAVVLALSELAIIFLGADTPIPDLAAVAHDSAATAVVVSVSIAADWERVTSQLYELRRLLDAGVSLAIGGAGAFEANQGIAHLEGLHAVAEWAETIKDGR